MTPVVLHHGLFGFGNLRLGPIPIRYFAGGIERVITDRGHPLILARTHPTGSIELRARQLKEQILRQLDALGPRQRRVIIIAHSLGGLDARYMISHLGMAERVESLVTIATPHRGSSYADWVMQHLGDRLGGTRLVAALGIDLRAIGDLTTTNMADFNRVTPDAPGIEYLSIAGVQRQNLCAPVFLHSHGIVFRGEGENDGVVSLGSAKWGRFLGTWPADHLHLINKRFTPEMLHPKHDVAPRYAALLANLRTQTAPTQPPKSP